MVIDVILLSANRAELHTLQDDYHTNYSCHGYLALSSLYDQSCVW